MSPDTWVPPAVLVAVDLVIFTLRGSRLHVLLIERGIQPFRGAAALPGGFLNHAEEDLLDAAHRELSEEAGLTAEYLHLEPLGVYGTPGRDPRGRIISVAYLAIAPQLPEPVAGTDACDARWTRVDEALSPGADLAFDHRVIITDGLARARAKLEHSALATAFCGPTFTISELQAVYEAVWGLSLDPRNFYRKVQSVAGFIVPTGAMRKTDAGRPARLYRRGPRQALNPPMTQPGEASRMDTDLVVILTALNLEYEAVRNRLTDLQVHRHAAGTRFEVGRLRGTDHRVALGLVGKGNHPAAVLAERAIAQFAPVAILFVGVAGALWSSIRLGDVVVASQIYAYHGGTSEDDGLKARPRAWEISHDAAQLAHHVIRTGTWSTGIRAAQSPAVHFGPIAAGEIVQDSAVSEQARWVRQHYNDALAIEMEAAGVAQAAHLNRALPVVVVRGISDRADGAKSTADAQNWQPTAAEHAAAFASALAADLASDSTRNRPTTPWKGGSEPMMATSSTNVATGNARVGIQAGQIFGGVTIGSPTHASVDLAAELAELRTRLKRAHRDGELDQEIYAAAETELNCASECLAAGSGRGRGGRRGGLVVALKKLGGLVGDVAELATRIATIIAVAKEL